MGTSLVKTICFIWILLLMFSDMPVIEFPVLLLIPITRGDFPPMYTPSNHRNWPDTTKLTIMSKTLKWSHWTLLILVEFEYFVTSDKMIVSFSNYLLKGCCNNVAWKTAPGKGKIDKQKIYPVIANDIQHMYLKIYRLLKDVKSPRAFS